MNRDATGSLGRIARRGHAQSLKASTSWRHQPQGGEAAVVAEALRPRRAPGRGPASGAGSPNWVSCPSTNSPSGTTSDRRSSWPARRPAIFGWLCPVHEPERFRVLVAAARRRTLPGRRGPSPSLPRSVLTVVRRRRRRCASHTITDHVQRRGVRLLEGRQPALRIVRDRRRPAARCGSCGPWRNSSGNVARSASPWPSAASPWAVRPIVTLTGHVRAAPVDLADVAACRSGVRRWCRSPGAASVARARLGVGHPEQEVRGSPRASEPGPARTRRWTSASTGLTSVTTRPPVPARIWATDAAGVAAVDREVGVGSALELSRPARPSISWLSGGTGVAAPPRRSVAVSPGQAEGPTHQRVRRIALAAA